MQESHLQADASSLSRQKVNSILPFWRRLAFATALPNAILYATLCSAFAVWRAMKLDGDETVGAGIGQGGMVVIAIIVNSLVLVGVPVFLCTLLAALRDWRHWYTAFAGGLAAMAIGMTVGGLAGLLIHLFA